MKFWYDKEFECVVCDANNAEECLQMIIDIGFDYDGYSKAEHLKELIDELVDYARRGLKFINEGKVVKEDTAEEDKESFDEAHMQRGNEDGEM